MTYKQAIKITKNLGFSVSKDGLGFTVCGGRLVNGTRCPSKLTRFNGSCVFEIARAYKSGEFNDLIQD